MFSQSWHVPVKCEVDAKNAMGFKKTFYCQICLIELNSEDTMLSHFRGAKHMKKARALECKGLLVDQPIIPIKNPEPTRKKVPSKLIDKIREDRSSPVVGLGYIKEFIPVSDSEMEPHYECELCGNQGQANCMFSHLMGRKHRRNFLDSMRYGDGVDTSELSPAQLREGAMLYDEKKSDIVSRITTIYSDSTYPWPCGKEPWNKDNGGIGIAPDDERSNYGKQQIKSEEIPRNENSSSSGFGQSWEEKSLTPGCAGWKLSGPGLSYAKTKTFQGPSHGQMLPNLPSELFTRPMSPKPFLSSTFNDQRLQTIQDARSMLELGTKMLLSATDFRGSGTSCSEKRLVSNCLTSLALKVGRAMGKSNPRLMPTETSASKLSWAAPVARSQSRPYTNKPSSVPREGVSCEIRMKDSILSEHLKRRSRSRSSTCGRIRSRSPRFERTRSPRFERIRSPSTASSSTGSTRSSTSTSNSASKRDSHLDMGWSRGRCHKYNKGGEACRLSRSPSIGYYESTRNKVKDRELVRRRGMYSRDDRH